MAKYMAYPEYKSSGVDWLGQIPSHWGLRKLSSYGDFTCGVGFPHEHQGLQDEEIPFFKVSDTNLPGNKIYLNMENNTINKSTALMLGAKLCKPGTIIFPKVGATLLQNKRRILSRSSVFDNNMMGFTPRVGHKKYWYYWLSELDFGQIANPGAIPSINENQLRAMPGLCPEEDEQKIIVDFLDYETSKIDHLIAKQERLIELLKEKRQALVNNAAFHPESVELRLGYAAKVVSRPVQQHEEEIYVPIGLYNRGRGIFHKEPRSMEEMGDSDFFWVKAGDLVISGQFAWEGAVALTFEEDEECVASHRFPILRGKCDIVKTEYLFSLLTTKFGDFLLNENSRGAAGRNRPLNVSSLMKEKISIPPMHIQDKVAKLVTMEKRISEKIKRQTELLKEHRSALISAAVTGKIDVRNWKPESSTESERQAATA